jgi:hypothetical protein
MKEGGVGRGIDGESVIESKNHTLIRQRQYSPGNGTIATTRGIFVTLELRQSIELINFSAKTNRPIS